MHFEEKTIIQKRYFNHYCDLYCYYLDDTFIMKTKIIDNWLEPDLAEFLSVHLTKNILYSLDHSSRPDTTESSFLMSHLSIHDPIILFLHSKINKVKKVNLLRSYVNCHYSCHGGSFHQDDGDTTFLYMPSKNVEGGEFEIFNQPRVEYKFNRLIYFNALDFHKGNPHTNNTTRLTLAFKTKNI